MDKRITKKFKLRMKAKAVRKGWDSKKLKPRIADADRGIISKVAVKKFTQKNPLANVHLSSKKRNQILKRRRYDERDRLAKEKASMSGGAGSCSDSAGGSSASKTKEKPLSTSATPMGTPMEVEPPASVAKAVAMKLKAAPKRKSARGTKMQCD